jgi:hypothetical protein
MEGLFAGHEGRLGPNPCELQRPQFPGPVREPFDGGRSDIPRARHHQDARLLPAAGCARRDGGPQHRDGGNARSAAMAPRIVWNRSRGTMTSAI